MPNLLLLTYFELKICYSIPSIVKFISWHISCKVCLLELVGQSLTLMLTTSIYSKL